MYYMAQLKEEALCQSCIIVSVFKSLCDLLSVSLTLIL
jgi:hypothetical protein